VEKEALVLPSLEGEIGAGLRLHYHGLHHENGEWWFTYGGKRKKLYGGKLLENIIQALDRVIVMGAAIRIQKRIHPYRLAQQAHDENAYIVREEHVETVKSIVLEEMVLRPVWAPTLPLAAEVGVGASYGEAK
jgi:DNA polymerase